MVFHTLSFFYFFIIVYSVSSLLNFFSQRSQGLSLLFSLNKGFLLGASYYFYAYWDYRFLSLIIISTIVDFWCGRRIGEAVEVGLKKKFLTLSLTVNLGILGFFKYCNFFIDSANAILVGANISVPHLEVILPIGISFFTFQSMSYSLDIYFGKLKPAKSWLDFFLYVAFFPQLVAGPIVRASHFLPQLTSPSLQTLDKFGKGLQIFMYGLFLKVVVADNIAPIIDPIFKSPQSYDSAAVWLAVLGYSVQIFCDFCGYSEMAIGIALSLGYELPVNFRTPYLASDLFDFWRRWHISLSSWLRDYLYIPLGGNRKGFARTCFNVFITMLLGGLWHGAHAKFLLWGAWHGLGLLVNRWLQKVFGERWTGNVALSLIKWAVTLLFVCFGWVLFRCENLDLAGQMYSKLLFLETKTIDWNFLTMNRLFFIPCMILVHLWFALSKRDSVYFKSGSFVSYFYFFTMAFFVALFAPIDYQGFIYFQF